MWHLTEAADWPAIENQIKCSIAETKKKYTTELLNVLHALALLVEMEPDQAKLLEAICEGPTLKYPPPDNG